MHVYNLIFRIVATCISTIRIVTFTLSGLFLLLLSGCAQQPPVAPMDLAAPIPDISARYVTERHHIAGNPGEAQTHHSDAHEIRNEWLFWRNTRRIEVSVPRQQTGEAWLKDGSTLFYQKLFHEDHKIVEYQSEDLDALNVEVSWRKNQFMIDPETLAQLVVKDERWIEQHPALELAGTVDGITYQVVWLVDLNLPYLLKKNDKKGNSELTTLQEIFTDNDGALEVPDSSKYEIIDYADLGDRERDPFVQRVQSHLVGGDWHTH